MLIDHFFICVQPGAPEAAALADFGLVEGSANRHPGQGTANRRFFFANAFLELLWLDDAAEAQSEATRPTKLFERLSGEGASPFGICFRPAPGDDSPLPFASWRYQPAYFPPGIACDIALAPLSEPMWFHLTPGGRPDALPPERAQPLAHRVPLREVTAVTVIQPRSLPSLALPVRFAQGDTDLLEIEFDGGMLGKVHDFRPTLPLVFKY
ncbi:VOC family protein [Pseudoduganella ginsengisoli]|uniref:Glyoxalase-like domain protein n=1 Tax=Pseudoduganella ginsengisoli TaxID=1462440 RepID=A0A6L6PWA6_9BURK|nr:VOC family protein [Pseudoduganella ginsengisoli]MTW01516.1 glyoxalase-like domain protein [Pseudoduganella ginsengisoli]